MLFGSEKRKNIEILFSFPSIFVVSCPLLVVSCQLLVVSCQWSVVSC
ncbi:MAG: hypothetical protein ACKPGP_18545 [Dolichospermum sp.]